MQKDIRRYRQEDLGNLTRLISQLQEHIASLDPYRRQKSGRDFDAGAYMEKTLKKVLEEQGMIFVAEVNDTIGGCIFGCIPEQSESDHFESYPVKEGVILELIVSNTLRGTGIGSELMKTMEDYFRKERCTYSRVSCFAPNMDAHRFYEKSGYGDRSLDMLKQL